MNINGSALRGRRKLCWRVEAFPAVGPCKWARRQGEGLEIDCRRRNQRGSKEIASREECWCDGN